MHLKKKNQICAVNGPQTNVIVFVLIKWFLYIKIKTKENIQYKKKQKMHLICEKNTHRTQSTKQMNLRQITQTYLMFNRHKCHAFNARA